MMNSLLVPKVYLAFTGSYPYTNEPYPGVYRLDIIEQCLIHVFSKYIYIDKKENIRLYWVSEQLNKEKKYIYESINHPHIT